MSRLPSPAQTAVGAGFWLLFAFLWVDLVRDGKATPGTLGASAGLLLAVAAVVLLVTLAWVRHNVGIHRRRGARQARPAMEPRLDVDRLGRAVVWRVPGGRDRALTAPHVVVDATGFAKVYDEPGGSAR